MEKYNATKFMETKDLGSVTKGFFKFTKKGKNGKNEMMTPKDIEFIKNGLEELDDYYEGLFENPEKFKEFFFLEFTIIKNKKK